MNETQPLFPYSNAETTQNGQVEKYQRSKESFQSCVILSSLRHMLPVQVLLLTNPLKPMLLLHDCLSCNFTKIGVLSSASSGNQGKQYSTIQKPVTTEHIPYQSRDPKCFLDHRNKSRPFQPS